MPYRNMTIEQLALHIGMDARLVRRWAEKGRLPGHMVCGEWRFNGATMLEFLQSQMHTFDEEHIRNLERAMREDDGESRLIEAHLGTEAVEMNLAARSRASVLRELVLLAERTGLVWNGPEIISALEEREAMGSTGLPRGIAFPHPRRPLMYATAEPLVCLARVPAGIPFGAPDGRLTDLFVLVLAHGEKLHLGLLARLAMMFNTDLPDRLREAGTADDALALMIHTEAKVLSRR